MSLPITAKEVPFFKLIIPLLAGIVCQYWLAILDNAWWNYVVALLLISILFLGYFFSAHWRYRWVFGFVLNLSLLFFGALLTLRQPLIDKIEVNSGNETILRLLDDPQVRAKSIRVEAEIKSVYSKSIWWSVNEKILIYFNLRDSLACDLRYGTLLAVNLTPHEVLQQGNPEQFDFKKYLSDRGVRLTAYVQQNQWIKVGYDGNALKRVALDFRIRLMSLFKQYGLSGDELAVASALTLGYQDLLDDELRHVYSSSGAMHILAVSGLHVGVLYVLLSFLLTFLDKRTITRAIKVVVLLCFLWFFALLTGLPTSVQRSALMFSFLVVGDFFSRKSNIYNTLAASAFVLLIINPYNLFNIGFQLSYLAVLSIVFFYPYVYRLIYVKNWALDKIWSLIAVSIAAQVGTFSLTLFYFNQFPNYFLLSNLIAIPLSTIALYLAVLLIIVSPVQFISVYVGKALSITISLLNHGLEFVEKLPFSVSDGFNISSIQMLILFLLILVLTLFLVTKYGRYLIIVLSLFVILLGLNFISKIKKSYLKEFVVFNIGKSSLVSFRSGNKLVFVDTDSSKRTFGEKYDFFTKGYISKVCNRADVEVINPFDAKVAPKINSTQFALQHGVTIFNFDKKLIAITYDKSLDGFESRSWVDVDYLVINQFYPSTIFNYLNPKMVIVDSSVSKYKVMEIALKCRHDGIPCYIVSTHGAFIKTI
ncbi:MAG TPA: hypothetical protein DIW31_04620 [Bacteroidales bacterium]|nr:hypothetical protein [Bacteroidales bacterium]